MTKRRSDNSKRWCHRDLAIGGKRLWRHIHGEVEALSAPRKAVWARFHATLDGSRQGAGLAWMSDDAERGGRPSHYRLEERAGRRCARRRGPPAHSNIERCGERHIDPI